MEHAFFLLIFLISTLGYILWVTELLEIQPEAAPVFVIFSQIVILYLFSLAGWLLVAAYLIHVLGYLALLAVLWKHRHDLRAFVRKQATPAFAFWGLLALVFWYQTRTWQFASWDEFSHWGLILKEISLTNALPGANTALIFPDYPPGSALYQYFVNISLAAGGPGFQEGSAYFAQGLMVLSPLISLTRRLTWKKWPVVLGVYGAGYLLFHLLGYTLTSIYVDGLLGVIFGAALAFCLTEKEISPKTFLYLLPMLFALPLIKKSGIYFSFATVLLALGWYVFLQKDRLAAPRRFGAPLECRSLRREAELKGWLLSAERQNWARALPLAALLLALLFGPLLFVVSWNRHVADFEQQTGIKISVPPTITLQQVNRSFFAEATPRDVTTINAFVLGLQEKTFGKNANDLTTRTLVIVFLAVIYLCGTILYEPYSNEKRAYFIIQGLTLFFVLLYFVAILISYLYVFTEYEGTRIASFDRYVGTALLGWGMVILAFLALPQQAPQRFPNHARGLSLTILVVLLLTLLLKTPLPSYLYPPQGLKNGRDQIILNVVKKFSAMLPPDSKVYDIWQNTTGIEHYMTRYELFPRRTEYWGWSLGEPYRDSDVWTVNQDPAAWLGFLQSEKYNYVLVSQPDEIFWGRYGRLFKNYDPSTEAQLFRVTPDGLLRVR